MNPDKLEIKPETAAQASREGSEKKSPLATTLPIVLAGTMLASQILGAGKNKDEGQASISADPKPITEPLPNSDISSWGKNNKVLELQDSSISGGFKHEAGILARNYEDYFSYEINTYKYFNEIFELKKIIDNLPEDFDGELGNYLRQTEWYASIEKNSVFEGAIDTMNITKVEGQPLQCVVFAILLGSLKDSDLQVQNIGGASAFDLGERKAVRAIEFVPFEMIDKKYRDIVANGYGGVTLRTTDFEIEDFVTGDVIILGNRGRIIHLETPSSKAWETHIGHVAVIIGETRVGGEDMLLVAESNRNNDGQITITLVDESNLSEVVDPGSNTFVIRMNKNYSPIVGN